MRLPTSPIAKKDRRPTLVALSAAAVLAVFAAGYVRTRSLNESSTGYHAPEVRYKDGTYSGWGRSRHGSIQATVVVRRGRIASAAIAQCRTRYSCSVIAELPAQVVSRQSAQVDYVSGATQSASAFADAVFDALSHAL